MNIAVVGAGMMGQVLAWYLSEAKYTVSLFDQNEQLSTSVSPQSAAFAAAGMLAPYSEMDTADDLVFSLGLKSLTLWRDLADQLTTNTGIDIDYRETGTLVLAHPQDQTDLTQFLSSLKSRLPSDAYKALQSLDRNQLKLKAAEISKHFDSATFIKHEACVSPKLALRAITNNLELNNVRIFNKVKIENLQANSLESFGDFDHIFDCRGIGAKSDIAGLRGVRGETILVKAPDVTLDTTVRLMHPRYKLYIAPRKDKHFLLGASQIESNSRKPVSVRTALELLSAAYSIDHAFGEASIIEMNTGCRPALPDNRPKFYYDGGIFRINGLFRHGVLLSPVIAEVALNYLTKKTACIPEHHNFLANTVSDSRLTA